MRPGSAVRARLHWLIAGVSALALLAAGGARAQEAADLPGLELTSPVRLQLRLLNEYWRAWTRACYEAQEDAAASALEELLATARRLGMPRLPDLSSAASGFAVSAAATGDFERSRWALDAARQLDPGRPETDFAAATVKRLAGDYLGVVTSGVKGCAAILKLPLERGIWLQNAGLWLLYTLLVSGGLFVALQMATKGRALVYDLVRFMSPPMASTAAELLTVAVLVWPLVLPSGLLWLAIYWSILLWGYGSVSERVVLLVLWLSLGVGSLALSFQQRAVQLALSPPMRAVDNLAADRLYGALFSDLGVLRTLMPNHPVARELTADVHRRLGQWEHARALYTALIEAGELQGADSAAARNNLGVYHHRRKDYGTAVNYFRQASQYDPHMAEAFFNLAQAYSQLYQFQDSNTAMAEAKELDRGRVTAWENADVPVEELAVGVDGGLHRGAELRRTLDSIWHGEEASQNAADLLRRHFSLSVVAGIMILALTLHLVRSQLGYRSDALEIDSLLPESLDRWASALVPGLASSRDGRGGRAFLAILLPAALLIAPLVRGLGYRLPLAYDLNPMLPAALSFGGLALVFLVRARHLVGR
jgi:tetratricopeptide (TPR) repeat protein